MYTWIDICISTYLFKRNHKWDTFSGIFIISYSLMQLFEAMIWYDQKCWKN